MSLPRVSICLVLANTMLAIASLPLSAEDLPTNPGASAPQILAPRLIDAESARGLEAVLQAWIAGILGPELTPPPGRITIQPDGVAYRLALSLGAGSDAQSLTASLIPVEQDAWQLRDIRLPARFAWTGQLDGLRGALPAPTGPGQKVPPGPVRIEVRIANQNAEALIDPTLRTPSSLVADWRGIQIGTEMAGVWQVQQFETYRMRTLLVPQSDGRLDLRQDGSMTGWSRATSLPVADQAAKPPADKDQPGPDAISNGAVAVTIQRQESQTALTGLNGANLLTVVRGMAGIATLAAANLGAQDGQGGGSIEAPVRAAFRAILPALSDLARTARGSTRMEGIHVAAEGYDARFASASASMDLAAPDKLLALRLDLAIDGMELEGIPPLVAAYAPKSLELRQAIGGVPGGLVDLLGELLDAPSPAAEEQVKQKLNTLLFTQGGPTYALDLLSFDVGPARIRASGKASLPSPDAADVKARLSAAGLDALLTQVKSDREAMMVLPFLAILRQLARPVGDLLVWDVDWNQLSGKLLINGADMTSLAGPPRPPRR